MMRSACRAILPDYPSAKVGTGQLRRTPQVIGRTSGRRPRADRNIPFDPVCGATSFVPGKRAASTDTLQAEGTCQSGTMHHANTTPSASGNTTTALETAVVRLRAHHGSAGRHGGLGHPAAPARTATPRTRRRTADVTNTVSTDVRVDTTTTTAPPPSTTGNPGRRAGSRPTTTTGPTTAQAPATVGNTTPTTAPSTVGATTQPTVTAPPTTAGATTTAPPTTAGPSTSASTTTTPPTTTVPTSTVASTTTLVATTSIAHHHHRTDDDRAGNDDDRASVPVR